MVIWDQYFQMIILWYIERINEFILGENLLFFLIYYYVDDFGLFILVQIIFMKCICRFRVDFGCMYFFEFFQWVGELNWIGLIYFLCYIVVFFCFWFQFSFMVYV